MTTFQAPAVITQRDLYAAFALMGLLASRNGERPRFQPQDDAAYVFAVADAMLVARDAKPGPDTFPE